MPVTNYLTLGDTIIGERVLGGSRRNYAIDALGSVTGTLTSTIENTYLYAPYGTRLEKTGVASDPSFQWVGTRGCLQTGRLFAELYIRARNYSKTFARWTTLDPLWPNEQAFAYAEAAPISHVDSTGLKIFYPNREDCEWVMNLPENRGDPSVPNDHALGVTRCFVGRGSVFACYRLDGCRDGCIMHHESVHISDLEPCCELAGKCAQRHPVRICEDVWDGWMKAVNTWSECHAYMNTQSCIKQTQKRLECNVFNEGWGCCKTLYEWSQRVDARVKLMCPGTYRECPFLPKGGIKWRYSKGDVGSIRARSKPSGSWPWESGN